MHKYHTNGAHNTCKIITVILRFLTGSSREAASSECSLACYLWWSWCISKVMKLSFPERVARYIKMTILGYNFFSRCIWIARFFSLCIAYFQQYLFTVSSVCLFLFYFLTMLQKCYLVEVTGFVCFKLFCFLLVFHFLNLSTCFCF